MDDSLREAYGLSDEKTAGPSGRPPKARRSAWSRAKSIVHADSLAETNLHLKAVTNPRDAATIRSVIDLTLRIADLALSTGASAAEATAMALRVLGSYQLQAHVDVTYTAVTISIPGGAEHDPLTAMRRTRSQTTDYDRLAHLEHLVDRIADHSIDLRTARRRFDDLAVEPRVYRQWVITVASAGVGGSFALQLGGGWWEFLFGFVSAGLVRMIIRVLDRYKVPGLFEQMVGAMVPTTFGVLVMAFWPGSAVPSPSVIVGAGIVGMLAGIGLTDAARDALDGYYITSSARMYEAMVMTTGIVLGVIFTLWLGQKIGLPSYINPITGSASNAVLRVACAGLTAMFFGITCYAAPKAAMLAWLLGMLSQIGRLVGDSLTSFAPAAVLVPALVVGACAALAARRWNIPAAALIATGIIPQVPGMAIYRGVFFLLENPNDPTLGQASGLELMTALLTGVALAIGTSAGAMLMRPFTMPTERAKRVALAKAWHRNHAQSR